MASPNIGDSDLYADRTHSVVAAASASIAICLTFYGLRILSRLVAGTKIIASDVWLIGGVVACITISCIDLYGQPFNKSITVCMLTIV